MAGIPLATCESKPHKLKGDPTGLAAWKSKNRGNSGLQVTDPLQCKHDDDEEVESHRDKGYTTRLIFMHRCTTTNKKGRACYEQSQLVDAGVRAD